MAAYATVEDVQGRMTRTLTETETTVVGNLLTDVNLSGKGMGVVIGETAEIGDNCTLYQGVTLGGTGKDTGKRHPTLGSGVMVGAGAKVLGPFKIGDNAKIAANAVVLKDIPENSTAVGIPARIARQAGRRVDDLDQIHIPDPVAQEISKLEKKINELERELTDLKTRKKAAGPRKVKR